MTVAKRRVGQRLLYLPFCSSRDFDTKIRLMTFSKTEPVMKCTLLFTNAIHFRQGNY